MLLDIGAGQGAHVIHYARRFPGAEVVGLEPDEPSIAAAISAIAEADLTDRVTMRADDADDLDADGVYDLVTMNIALHEIGGWDEYTNVLDRVRRALRPSGTIVVSEIPYPDTPTEYRSHVVYKMSAGVQLHEAIVGCGMITQGQLRELLEGAGFDNVRIATQPMPNRHVMAGDKPDDHTVPARNAGW